LEEVKKKRMEKELGIDMGTELENKTQEDTVSVTPIAPINDIQINISKGGVENADISTGE